ncbi:hypothetical protein Adeg_1317 [Ammonifex degensii KC4]|uniref:Uncharacterized protein n=1 Tax=Ammonifex degensii (strain DSM 10501 / KC4) TaxID=429009 RepID=C9R7Z5_AMMDK|nr:hypothetical protein [Ammonifex degensii]ACX52424.1 hypothetical protein Adeg_1317 [Ammonifex degensii KC4]
MKDNWQWLKLVTAFLFLLVALILHFSGEQAKIFLILKYLFVFLGVFYVVSFLVFRWFLRKLGEEGEDGGK